MFTEELGELTSRCDECHLPVFIRDVRTLSAIPDWHISYFFWMQTSN